MGAWRIVEQAAGGLIFAFVVVDIFLTVLYARIGSSGLSRLGAGLLSVHLGRLVRATLLPFAHRSRNRHGYLSFCGPVTMVLLVVAWVTGLLAAAGLVLHPLLGSTVVSSNAHATDFITAVYAGGTSLAVNGASDYLPRSAPTRILYVIGSFAGLSIVTLTVTYLLQVYRALETRNNVAIDFHAYSDFTGDAAEVIVAFGRRGDFSFNSNNLAGLAEGMGSLRECHHFYPVIFFFAPVETLYAPSRFMMVALDMVTLMRTALGDVGTVEVGHAASCTKLWHVTISMADTLGGAFLDQPTRGKYQVTPEIGERWRARFHAARGRLAGEGIHVVEDESAAADRYIELRSRWQQRIEDLGLYMGLTREEIDPASYAREPLSPPSR